MKSYLTKEKEVERKQYVIDAKDKVFGRLASEVTNILRGRRKPIYTPSADTGDHVIVINTGKVHLAGKKWDQKQHVYRIGYPGGRRGVPYKELLGRHSERIVEHAIKGVMPKNSLGRQMLHKLRVYTGSEYLHEAQSPETYKF